MGRFGALAITTLLLGGTALAPSAAEAALTLSASIGGGALAGTIRQNFDSLTAGSSAQANLPGMTVTFTPDAQAVSGSATNQYAAPFLSGSNGTGFGSPNQPNGADSTVYLTSGKDGTANPGAKVTLTLASLSTYLGFLWGSVDNYNTVEFFNGNTPVGSLTGNNVSVDGLLKGNQGANGTVYANITSTLPFNRVVFSSTEYAFEFDNVAFVPIPGAALLFGSALAGLAWVRRRGGQKADAPLAA